VQEVTAIDLDEIDDLVCRMIGHAHLARAYGDALARDPGLSGGFGKLRDKHCSALAALSSEIGRAATAMASVAAPFAVAEGSGAQRN
jgi:hypothetical protein